MRLLATVMFAATSVASVASAQTTTLEQRLQVALDSAVATQHLPGATAAVSIGGRVTTVAAGFADRERGIAMSVGHRMLVGSATKPFFAFVALSLANEGTLDLDVPVSRWLGSEPWFARVPNAARLTTRMLLAHRGGVPNHVADSAFIAAMRDTTVRMRGLTPVEQIAFVLDVRAPLAPGSAFLYSDTGYLLAALALERATKTSYYDALATRVLGPLDLTATEPATRPDLAALAQGYVAPPPPGTSKGFSAWGLRGAVVRDGGLIVNPVYEWTGGGLVSTSADLAQWMETLFHQSPWQTIGASMVSAAEPADGSYGLGIFVRHTADGVLYWHPGGFPGYHTQVAYSPELNAGIAFQVNTDRVDGAAVLHALLAAVRAGDR